MTWLASSWIENLTPSSEEKEPIGDRVPEVSTMLRTDLLRSEKACVTHTKSCMSDFSVLNYSTLGKTMHKESQRLMWSSLL